MQNQQCTLDEVIKTIRQKRLYTNNSPALSATCLKANIEKGNLVVNIWLQRRDPFQGEWTRRDFWGTKTG